MKSHEAKLAKVGFSFAVQWEIRKSKGVSKRTETFSKSKDENSGEKRVEKIQNVDKMRRLQPLKWEGTALDELRTKTEVNFWLAEKIALILNLNSEPKIGFEQWQRIWTR